MRLEDSRMKIPVIKMNGKIELAKVIQHTPVHDEEWLDLGHDESWQDDNPETDNNEFINQ